ncbi:MAG TPA: hypothetical protein VHQ66_04845 [Myxococcota bacterium]|nr:hypothetical protein [Myxococcota bacterium]
MGTAQEIPVGEDPRIARVARVIEAGGCAIGALFDLADAHPGFTVTDSLAFPDGPLAPALTAIFGRRVDVVAYAATHRSHVARRDGVLFVNPGSPNLPSDGRGTVANPRPLRRGPGRGDPRGARLAPPAPHVAERGEPAERRWPDPSKPAVSATRGVGGL